MKKKSILKLAIHTYGIGFIGAGVWLSMWTFAKIALYGQVRYTEPNPLILSCEIVMATAGTVYLLWIAGKLITKFYKQGGELIG